MERIVFQSHDFFRGKLAVKLWVLVYVVLKLACSVKFQDWGRANMVSMLSSDPLGPRGGKKFHCLDQAQGIKWEKTRFTECSSPENEGLLNLKITKLKSGTPSELTSIFIIFWVSC